MTWLDHALAVMFAIGFPLVAVPLYARRRPQLIAGDHHARLREYAHTVLWLVGMGVSTLLVWLGAGRDFSILGLTLPRTWPAMLAMAIALGSAAFLFAQVGRIRSDSRTRDAARGALLAVREFLPQNEQQARWFRAVSVSAGIGEELFYRGFLIWYLTPLVSLGGAIAASSILFGIAHVMHGAEAAVRSAVTGAVLAVLLVSSGTLLPCMIVHTAIDLSSGEAGYSIFGRAS